MGASFLGVLGATTNTNAHKHCFEAGLRIETAVSPQGDHQFTRLNSTLRGGVVGHGVYVWTSVRRTDPLARSC